MTGEQNPGSPGRICIQRQTASTGCIYPIEVMVNRKPMGVLDPDGIIHVELTLEPGSHTIHLRGGGLVTQKFVSVRAGATLTLVARFSNWGGGLLLEEPVDSEDGASGPSRNGKQMLWMLLLVVAVVFTLFGTSYAAVSLKSPGAARVFGFIGATSCVTFALIAAFRVMKKNAAQSNKPFGVSRFLCLLGVASVLTFGGCGLIAATLNWAFSDPPAADTEASAIAFVKERNRPTSGDIKILSAHAERSKDGSWRVWGDYGRSHGKHGQAGYFEEWTGRFDVTIKFENGKWVLVDSPPP